ncbi:TolC family protein [Leptospira barantonii]|uniref:Transporter n=1 Tax=Leptospira barantonii TaxID=2023184 RepID=A0ABX4NLP1_9LEPT|nr:TolC family protein [Leptospira barantonii]PJZ57209.1 hypothetical protein CH367_10770 [Leptospira barantonii]
MKSHSSFLIFLFMISPFSGEVFGENVLEFSEVWEKIRVESASLQTKASEVKTNEIAKSRSAKHWLPKVYADARTFRTDDPTLNFMGKLGQRSANASDFSTESLRYQPSNFLDSNNQPYNGINPNNTNVFAKDTLNHPGNNSYSKGTLGVELPLFEGGSKVAFHSIREKRLHAVLSEEKYFRFLEYSKAAIHYQSIVLAEENRTRAENLSEQIRNFLNRYRIGNRSNPVGFSGHLALQSLQLILDVSKKEFESLRISSEETLLLSAPGLGENFKPKRNTLFSFADKYLPVSKEKDSAHTPLTEVYRFQSEEAQEGIEAERAKFLPKIAAYAETYAYNGARNQANSYNAGVYLQMNLLDPSDLGALDEAKAKAENARKKSKEIRQNEENRFKILVSRERIVFENLNSIYESMRLQEEQLQVSQKLFRSGTIQAPQMAESFSAMANLLKLKSSSELEYLKIRSELSLYSSHENSYEK